MWMPMLIEHEIGVEIMGMPVNHKLSFADGMIGAVPVFETKEQAVAFAGDDVQVVELGHVRKD